MERIAYKKRVLRNKLKLLALIGFRLIIVAMCLWSLSKFPEILVLTSTVTLTHVLVGLFMIFCVGYILAVFPKLLADLIKLLMPYKQYPMFEIGDLIELKTSRFKETNPPLKVVNRDWKAYLVLRPSGEYQEILIREQKAYQRVQDLKTI